MFSLRFFIIDSAKRFFFGTFENFQQPAPPFCASDPKWTIQPRWWMVIGKGGQGSRVLDLAAFVCSRTWSRKLCRHRPRIYYYPAITSLAGRAVFHATTTVLSRAGHKTSLHCNHCGCHGIECHPKAIILRLLFFFLKKFTGFMGTHFGAISAGTNSLLCGLGHEAEKLGLATTPNYLIFPFAHLGLFPQCAFGRHLFLIPLLLYTGRGLLRTMS